MGETEILNALKNKPMTAMDIAKAINISKTAVQKSLFMMRKYNLVKYKYILQSGYNHSKRKTILYML